MVALFISPFAWSQTPADRLRGVQSKHGIADFGGRCDGYWPGYFFQSDRETIGKSQLVGDFKPFKKYESQLGLWNSQSNHQPDRKMVI